MKEYFRSAFEKYQKAVSDAREVAIEVLINLCKDNGGTIEVGEDDFICVTYDGGHHPEYATNAFSQVNAVFVKGDKLYLDIEDDDEYGIERVPSSEVITIAYDLLF